MDQFDDRNEMPLDEMLDEVIHSYLASEVHTITIGEIQSFDNSRQTANIQPVFKRKFVDDAEVVSLPLLEDVPVHFFGSGDFVQTVELKKGSYVILLVCERALDNWFESGGIVDPARSRKFDFSDSLALAGINPKPNFLQPGVEPGIGFRNRAGTRYIQLNEDGSYVVDELVRFEGGSSYLELTDSGAALVATLVKLGAEVGTLPLLKVSSAIESAWNAHFTATSTKSTADAAAWTALAILFPDPIYDTAAAAGTAAAITAGNMVGQLTANKTTKVEGV